MSVQLREGIWRMRDGFVTTIYWMPETEGHEAHWGNYLGEWDADGKTSYTDADSVEDLVEYLGPIPKTDWSAENDRLQTEIERLQTELKGYAADSHRQLRNLQESHNKVTATLQAEQRGEREGFRIAISMILEAVK